MAMETQHLDQLQQAYRQAVDQWVAEIRKEETLAANADHSLISLDDWQHATFAQEAACSKVKAAREKYQDGLREQYFGF
jgi:hypothetical protein